MSKKDNELIERTLAGDEVAFQKLYEKYVRKVYNLAYRMVGRDGDPEEMTQEIFYQVYKNLKNFQGKSQFYTWLYRVASNTCLQHIRKSGRSKGSASFEDLEESAPMALPAANGLSPEDEASQRLFKQELVKKIAELPENQRMVMVLGPIQGHSYEEMSDILGVSVTVIKGRLHRAREAMRSAFRHRSEGQAEVKANRDSQIEAAV